MLEKLKDTLKKQISSAYHTVIKSFRSFFPLMVVILLIECVLFIVFLSFTNNVSLREQQIREQYDHHLTVSGLTEAEMLLLRNDDRTVSRNAMCFTVIRTLRYDSTHYDPTYTVYIKILSGNKNYGIWKYFIDDSLETNFNAMCLRYHDVFGTEEQPNDHITLAFTPLYTEEEETDNLIATRTFCLILTSLLSAALFVSFYKIFARNKQFALGLYATFGATQRGICVQAMTELLVIALPFLIPSYYLSSLLCTLLYRSGGASYHFSLLSLPALFTVLLCIVAVLFFGALISLKFVTKKDPMQLIAGEDRVVAVTPPPRSQNLLSRTFPIGYETLSFWRFRRHYISLSFLSSLLSVVFVAGCYLSAAYRADAAVRYRTDPDFSVKFSSVETVEAERIALFREISGVSNAFIEPSKIHADTLSVLLSVAGENVHSSRGLAEDRTRNTLYTGDVSLISGGVDLAEYFQEFYGASVSDTFLTDPYSILIGNTFENRETFDFAVGDTVTLLIPELDEEGKLVYLDENAQKIVNATGLHYWEEAYKKLSFRTLTLTVAGVIDDYPSGAEGVPLVMHPDVYEDVTGATLLANVLTVRLAQECTVKDFMRVEDQFCALAARMGNCTVQSHESFFENRVERLYRYDSLMLVISATALLMIPLYLIYAQGVFFRKREREFTILRAISAPSNKIRGLYLWNTLFSLPVAALSLLFSALLCGGLFFFFERFLPNTLGIGSKIISGASLSPLVFVIGILISVFSAFLSALLPYLWYRKRYRAEILTNTFYSESEF